MNEQQRFGGISRASAQNGPLLILFLCCLLDSVLSVAPVNRHSSQKAR